MFASIEMIKKKRLAKTKSVRLLQEIADAIDIYADQELISANAAINRLLRESLLKRGLLPGMENRDTEDE